MAMKPIIFGEPIRAEDVEALRAEHGPTTFVRLCGALIGAAMADRLGSFALPEISERISVPDGGVDASFTTPDRLSLSETGGLIGPGRTVFQFKYRDVTRGPQPRLVKELVRRLKDDFSRIVPECDRYVLLTNLHLKPSERDRLRKTIESSVHGLAIPPLVWGAAEIAQALNLAAHLRHLFFSGDALCTLEVAEDELRRAYGPIGWPAFIDREEELAAIRSFVADDRARLLRVSGPRYVGKTRLVIEALKPRGSVVVWSSLPDGVTPDRFRDLDTANRALVVAVDRCDIATAARLERLALERDRVKTVLIVDGTPERGEAGATRALSVVPFPEDETLRLVREVAPGLAFRQASWVVEMAGGMPGLALHGAALVRDAQAPSEGVQRGSRGGLGSRVASAYLDGLDSDAQKALMVLALLPVIGVSDEAAAELDAVSRALGTTGGDVRRLLPRLRDDGLVHQRGRFREVIPPLLGDHLVSEFLSASTPRSLIAELMLALPENAFLRFLERLRNVDSPSVRSAITELLLSPHGWVSDLAALGRNARKVRILAWAVPAEALESLRGTLASPSIDRLRAELTEDARRSVVTTLEELALRSDTFEGAARLLLRLAEAENESWGNNASGVFLELFHWAHPEMGAPLTRRAAVLRDAAQDTSPRGRVLVAKTCGEAFRPQTIGLHRATGPSHPEHRYRPTWNEVRDYGIQLLRTLEGLYEDSEPEVREAARTAIVHAFRPSVTGGMIEDGLHEVANRAFGLLERIGRETPSARARSRVITELELLIENLGAPSPASQQLPERGRELALERARELASLLTGDTLKDQLWRWVGPSSHAIESKQLDNDPELATQLANLAGRLARDREALREHLRWLTGEEAVHRIAFFRALGEGDASGHAWPVLIESSNGKQWPEAFAAYCVGRHAGAQEDVDRELDRLGSAPEHVRGVLLASAWLLPGQSHLERLQRLLGSDVMSRLDIAREVALSAPWRVLAPADAERLLRALDDGTAEVRETLLFPFLVGSRDRAALTGSFRELAWSFLETVGPVSRREGPYTWDALAARLGQDDPARLARVLDRYIRSSVRRGRSGSISDDLPLSWRVLKTRERRGALELVLRAAGWSDTPWQIAQELPGLIDPRLDRDFLLAWLKQAGPGGARLLARSLDPERPAFWELAPDLIVGPSDDEAGADLIDRLHTGGWSGSALDLIDKRLRGARALTKHDEARVRAWAQRAVTALEAWRRREAREDQEEWIWDYRIRRTDLETMLQRRDSPERLWAIARLLEDAPEQRVVELLTPGEILDALPRLTHLDRRVLAKWETWARLQAQATRRD